MNENKTTLSKHVYNLALDVIESENYDIINEGDFWPTDFANAAANLFRNMITRGPALSFVFKQGRVCVFTLGLTWLVSNRRPCFISCSDDNATGVSRSLGCILTRIHNLEKDDVKELLDMMNEAWYLMKNA